MSGDANVDTVRAVYERWGRGEFGTGIEPFDDETELVLRREFPDAGTYRGAEGIAGYIRYLLSAWDRLVIEAEEVRGFGNHVLVRVCQRGIGSASGVETEFPYFMVWTFHGARAVHVEAIVDEEEEALAAAGERRGAA